ncbi:MAG: glycosyltransferase family 4 protein [Bacteroidota bacterium]|nr:glycosyltransferase family 4 protein [Bacteroidota bacterium]
MKILHLIYSSGIYGAEKHLLDLLPALKKEGINCELLFICPAQSIGSLQMYSNEMNAQGIKTALLPTKSKFFALATAKKIYRYLKSNDIKIVHSHLFSADLIAVLIKTFYSKKLVILSTKHGYEEKYLVQYGLGNKKIRYNPYYFISKAILKKTDHNLAVSSALSKLYSSIGLLKNRMKYIHHGINMQPSAPQKIGPEGYPKIMMVGRLSVIKGHIYIIEALPEVIKKFPGVKLLLLGDGPLKNKLINQAAALNVLDHIEFMGFANPEDYACQCQLMVQPSLFESFGLVYIEAFALKIPVVAFDAEAGNEIIENGETGILVPSKDVKALAESIIYLLESPGERNRIVANAYKKYLAYYNVERMGKETAEWYAAVLKNLSYDFQN